MSEVESKEISWLSFWRLAIVGILLFLFYYLRAVFGVIFFAVIISSAFTPLVDWFEKKKIGRILGSLIIYLLAFFLIGIFFYFFLPLVYRQLTEAIALIPGYSEKFAQSLIGSQIIENLNEFILSYGTSLIKGGLKIFPLLASIVGGLAYLISTILVSFYLLVRKEGVSEFIQAVFPNWLEEKALKVWQRSRMRIGRWFRTQLLLSLLVGFLVFLALTLLGVKYNLLLGILAAVFELVPIAGPIFAGIISTLVALVQSPLLAIWTGLVFILIQRLENDLIIPLVMKKSLGLSPVIVILAILSGAKLAGAIGVILALPVVVILEEVINEIKPKKTFSE